jgi:TonB family protein
MTAHAEAISARSWLRTATKIWIPTVLFLTSLHSTPAAASSLDRTVIQQVIRKHINHIRYCYETRLAAVPKLEGQVTIKFSIELGGKVPSAQVLTSSLSDAKAEQCILNVVRSMQFPPRPGTDAKPDDIVWITYPFAFKPATQAPTDEKPAKSPQPVSPTETATTAPICPPAPTSTSQQ